MSLTLRDAQHLCWKTYRKFQPKESKESNISSVTTDLEAKAHALACKVCAEPADKEELAGLLSQVLFDAFVAAEHSGLDLEESFLQSLDSYILNSVK